MQKRSHLYTVSIILFIGIFLRLLAIRNWSFGFDQVQILEAAIKIVSGDLTLIGPRTGPASLFTGPLIYYLTAFFYLLGFSYYSIIAATIFLAIITCLVIYFLLKRYFGQSFALLGIFLWAFSYALIRNDQVTWNPNLTILASSLLFFPLFASFNTKFKRIDYLFVFLGGFLAYQAHFSGFLFLLLSFLFFFSKYRFQAIKLFFATYFGFIFSLLPTILFDYKNNWLNLNGILEFITKLTSNNQDDLYIYHLWKSFYTTFENFGAVLFGNFSLPIQVLFVVGLLTFCYYFYSSLSKNKNYGFQQSLPILWISIITFIFSFYSGDKPPYYFLLQTPAILIIYIDLFIFLQSRFNLNSLKIIFIILAFSNSIVALFKQNSFSLSNSLEIRKYIENQATLQPIRKIIFHLPIGEDFGLKYLLSDLETTNENGLDWYLSYPNKVVFKARTFGQIDLWSQVPQQKQENLYFNDEFRVRTSSNLFIYRDEYYSGQADQAYLILNGEQKIAVMERYSLNYFLQNFGTFNWQINNWQIIDDDSAAWYYKPTKSVFFLSSFNKQSNIHETIQIF